LVLLALPVSATEWSHFGALSILELGIGASGSETTIIDTSGNFNITGTFAHTSTTALFTESTSFIAYTPDFRIGYDAGAYLKFAVSDTTGNVAITHAGSTKNVLWTTAGTFGLTTGLFTFTGTRSAVQTSDASIWSFSGASQLAGTTGRTFAVNISATRPDGSNFSTGGDDAGLKISVTNYEDTAQNGYYLRAFNAGATTRDGGTLGHLVGGAVAATQKASSPVVSDLIGLQITVEQDSPNATVPTNLFGATIRYDAVMASPANSAGLYVYCDSDTALADPLAGLWVGNSAADRDWQYGLYIGDSAVSTADIRLTNGETISNATDGIVMIGDDIGIADGGEPTGDVGAIAVLYWDGTDLCVKTGTQTEALTTTP